MFTQEKVLAVFVYGKYIFCRHCNTQHALCLLLLLGLVFILIFIFIVLFDQIANDWQESCKS